MAERDGRRERNRQPIREWDKDKVNLDSPEKRRVEPKDIEKKEKQQQRRGANEETPAKLLDDLFQKTKATPCIYWLPLSQEQAKARAEKLKGEREKRDQENKRPRSRQRGRETDVRRSSTRSRSPPNRRR